MNSDVIADAFAGELEAARDAGRVGYMARALIQATLPHRRFPGSAYERSNGWLTLRVVDIDGVGVPFGTIPRLLTLFLTSEATRTGERRLVLGDSLGEFLGALGMVPSGGRWGTITRVREQADRLFSSVLSLTYRDDVRGGLCTRERKRLLITEGDKEIYFWASKRKRASLDQRTLWSSTVTLTPQFFEEITTSPVPVEIPALRQLTSSPLAIDLYCWMTHRMSYLRKPTTIPWALLQMQFGVGYPQTPQGLRDFRRRFWQAAAKVHAVYPAARLRRDERGLRLLPSPTSVPRIRF